jgi:hypothetical protein
MSQTASSSTPHVPLSRLLHVVLLAVATAASWFAWLGWDHEYQTDPVTGIASGPYEAWQVVGCVLTLLVIGVAAVVLRVRPVLAALTMTIAFTVSWCVTEMPGDDTGMSGVGAVMVLVGTGCATALWFGVATAVRSGRRR